MVLESPWDISMRERLLKRRADYEVLFPSNYLWNLISFAFDHLGI
jgi:hypothetical protein